VPHPTLGGPIFRASIPIQLASEASLLAHLDISGKELKKIWWFRGHMYRQFEIAKGKGKIRVIHAPNDRLKFLQREIAPLLDQLYHVRHPVHGFVVGKSVKTNAPSHLGKRFVLNVDLKDFFPSITEKRVTGVLKALGVSGTVARIIARLCCHNFCLPEGAPTSPVLSNMICFKLDKQLHAFTKSARCIYTRYADDITFSSDQPMTALFVKSIPASGNLLPDLLDRELRNIFLFNSFTINPDKVHYADRHSRRVVTGLKVNACLSG
jgi:RNA-directed DNA polymerase